MMMSKQDSFNIRASEELLGLICDVLFQNADRYLRVKDRFTDQQIRSFGYDKHRFRMTEEE